VVTSYAYSVSASGCRNHWQYHWLGVFRTQGQIAANLPNIWWFLGVWIVGASMRCSARCKLLNGDFAPTLRRPICIRSPCTREYAGFLVGWSDWISTCGSTAAVGIVIGEFSAALFRTLQPYRILLSATIISLFALLQWRGIVLGSGVQNLTSLSRPSLLFCSSLQGSFSAVVFQQIFRTL